LREGTLRLLKKNRTIRIMDGYVIEVLKGDQRQRRAGEQVKAQSNWLEGIPKVLPWGYMLRPG